MIVSYLPDPERHPLWNGIRALLEPAAQQGGYGVRDEDELVWIAFDGPTIFAAGTTAMWSDGEAEIRLCAGTRHREWVGQALQIVESWARDAGASRLTMRGRRGWLRYIRRFGWDAAGIEGGKQVFEKVLQ